MSSNQQGDARNGGLSSETIGSASIAVSGCHPAVMGEKILYNDL
jgi:hypothetical protein